MTTVNRKGVTGIWKSRILTVLGPDDSICRSHISYLPPLTVIPRVPHLIRTVIIQDVTWYYMVVIPLSIGSNIHNTTVSSCPSTKVVCMSSPGNPIGRGCVSDAVVTTGLSGIPHLVSCIFFNDSRIHDGCNIPSTDTTYSHHTSISRKSSTKTTTVSSPGDSISGGSISYSLPVTPIVSHIPHLVGSPIIYDRSRHYMCIIPGTTSCISIKDTTISIRICSTDIIWIFSPSGSISRSCVSTSPT